MATSYADSQHSLPGDITQSASIAQTYFRISTERNTGPLARIRKAEVPALGAVRIHEKRKAIKVRKGIVFGARFGVPDRRIGKDHRTNSTHMNEGVLQSIQSAKQL